MAAMVPTTVAWQEEVGYYLISLCFITYLQHHHLIYLHYLSMNKNNHLSDLILVWNLPVANRIKEGKFSLDGKDFTLAVNNGANALHGGLDGFDKKNWTWQIVCPDLHISGFVLSYSSADGEEGYPGCLDVDVYYLITSQNELVIRYLATTDAGTVHPIWNIISFSFISHHHFSQSLTPHLT